MHHVPTALLTQQSATGQRTSANMPAPMKGVHAGQIPHASCQRSNSTSHVQSPEYMQPKQRRLDCAADGRRRLGVVLVMQHSKQTASASLSWQVSLCKGNTTQDTHTHTTTLPAAGITLVR